MSRRSPFHLVRTALVDPSACWLAYRAIRSHYAVQSLWELTHLISEAARLRPATVFEIGTHRGGTLYCWSRIVQPEARIVSLDLPFDSNDPHTTVAALEKLVLPGAQKCTFIRDNSHLPETKAKVQSALEGRAVDVLFIDGDHSYEGVRQDFEMYRGLVRSGGLIAFHDIAPNPDVPEYGVAKFWQEVKANYPTQEFIDPQPTGKVGMGIGVVSVG